MAPGPLEGLIMIVKCRFGWDVMLARLSGVEFGEMKEGTYEV